MISDKKLQGRFHLLAIFLIPANMMAIFLSSSWWMEILIHAGSALLVIFALRKKKE
jgi:hypothetical protein